MISYGCKFDNFLQKCRRSELFRDSFWALLGGVLGKGLSFVAGVVVARLLGSSVFGEYGIIRSTLTYIAIISTFGFGYTATKFVAEYVKNSSAKVWHLIRIIKVITILTGVIFTILQILFADIIANFIKAPYLENTIRIFSILTLLNAITTTQIAILSGLKEFRNITRINTVAGVITFVASVVLSFYYGLNGALLAILLSFLVQAIMSETIVHNKTKCFAGRDKISRADLAQLLYISCPVALQDGLYAVTQWLATYIIILAANYNELGLLNAANLWQVIVVSIPVMLKNVMLSYLTVATDHRSLVRKLIYITTISSALPAGVIIVFSNFLEGMYGASFMGVQPIIVVACCSSVLICVADVFVYELLAKNRSWFIFASRLIRDVLTLLVAYILLKNADSSQALVYSLVALGGHFIYLLIMTGFYKIFSK